MHDLDKPLPELLKMLQTAEENLTKGKGASVLMVQGGKGKPKKGIKIKARTVGKPKSKSTSSATQKPIGGVAKGKCHHCGKAGHWRRNCKTYLATKKKEGTTISSEVYVIEVNMSISSSWVLDTRCGSHICTTMQGLKQSRRLARGEIELRVGNGAPVAALAIRTYSLVLPSGLTKNVFYANAIMTNGLYVLDLDMPVYNISAKRNKPNGLNQTYLWHCRLCHINEKCISKLHRSGMLESFDLESYDTCESCLLVPTKAVEGTPYQLWTGKCPVLSHLKIWGCEAYVKRLMTNGKLDAKSDKCFFVGYPKETRGYSFYHPIDKKVFVARNGVFLEKEFLSNATSGRKIELEEIRDDEEITAPVQEHELEEQTGVPQNAQDTQEPRKSNRLRTQPERIVSANGEKILPNHVDPETRLQSSMTIEIVQ
ncbi:unnamed protein product [Cuscuta campestris]|uniref:CCHC-type domain-containing protein n=1 Tax=Cuscuta campestris TaxID=132261 RepID=A0A484ND92_9ASTE|nr:unnamed protein product [Cuscuta campestris]